MKTIFLLARHGQTRWNQLRKLQGRLDSPMTKVGIEQAKNLAQTMATKAVDLIVTSPLPRARITAGFCQQRLNCAIHTNQHLIERHFGQWQGHLFDALKDEPNFSDIFFTVSEHAPPKGESGFACANRFEQALIELATSFQGKTILVVTHGDVLRCFSSKLNQVAFCDAYSQYGNGSVIKIEFEHEHSRFVQTID